MYMENELDINWGALSIRYYLEQYKDILSKTVEFGVLLPDIDSQGGVGFKLYGHTFLMTLDTLSRFALTVITNNNDLIFLDLGDSDEFVSFLELMKLNIILHGKDQELEKTFDSFFDID